MGLSATWHGFYEDIVYSGVEWMTMELEDIKTGMYPQEEEDDQWGQSLAK